MENISIVINGNNLFIGKLNENTCQMEDPRVISAVQDQAGRMQAKILPILGMPKMITFGSDISYYTPTDQALIFQYVEATSTIKIATAMPKL